jgi:capsular polysaccharide biosynthesis protein
MPVSSRSRRRVLVALAGAAVLGAAGGGVIALARPVTYTATGTIFVSTTGVRSVEDLSQPPTFVQEVRSSYAGVATAPIVLQPVIDRLHLDTSVTTLAKRMSVDAPADTALLDIGVTDASASRAAAIANAVQDQLVDVSSSLAPTTSTAHRTVMMTAVQHATSAPSEPSPAVIVLAGALAGVLVWAVALVIVLLRRTPPPPPGHTAPSML